MVKSSCGFFLQKLLIYSADLCASGGLRRGTLHVLQRLLHHRNSFQVRQEGIRLFLIWYQMVGHSSTDDAKQMFASLVPGLVPGIANPFVSKSFGTTKKKTGLPHNSLFETIDFTPTEVEPLPAHGLQVPLCDVTCCYLKVLLDCMLSQVDKIFRAIYARFDMQSLKSHNDRGIAKTRSFRANVVCWRLPNVILLDLQIWLIAFQKSTKPIDHNDFTFQQSLQCYSSGRCEISDFACQIAHLQTKGRKAKWKICFWDKFLESCGIKS